MTFELQPSIENRWIRLEPLGAADFEALYTVALERRTDRQFALLRFYKIDAADWVRSTRARATGAG